MQAPLAPEWDPGKRENWKTGSQLTASSSALECGYLRQGRGQPQSASLRHHSIVLLGSQVTLVLGLQPHHCRADLQTGVPTILPLFHGRWSRRGRGGSLV